MSLKYYRDKDENEQLFQEAQKVGDNDTMWECVFIACLNVAKSIYAKRSFTAQEDDLYDAAMNATMRVMKNISEKGVKIDKLSSYVYLQTLCFVNGYKEDKMSKKLKAALCSINENESFLNEYIEEELYE